MENNPTSESDNSNTSTDKSGGDKEEKLATEDDKLTEKSFDPLLQNRPSSVTDGEIKEGTTTSGDDSRSQDSISNLLCLEDQPMSPTGEQGDKFPDKSTPETEDNSNTSTDKSHGDKEQMLAAENEEKKPEEDKDDGGLPLPVDNSKSVDPAADKIVTPDEDDDDDNPVSGVRLRMEGIFEEEDDDDDDVVVIPNDDSQNDDIPDIQSMLHMSFREGDSQEDQSSDDIIELNSSEVIQTEYESPTRRPQRAAAAAAATTIREISSHEIDIERSSSSNIVRRRVGRDPTHAADGGASQRGIQTYPAGQRVLQQQCTNCKKRTICDIKVQQFGTDVYFCNNACFSKHRKLLHDSFVNRSLPCANVNCGIRKVHQNTDRTYYWGTMNFCSDRCVGAYQTDVGGQCANCSNNVPWTSLGKYCVRFGSDIRQFCSAPCLESFKKNARVCFHCQLDIKRLQNVILANLPAKQCPKEFCSQTCVEMYVEQNINNTGSQSSHGTCVICGEHRPCFKELMLSLPDASHNAKTCSEQCWTKLLDAKRISNPVKCETCLKYVNLTFCDNNASQYISTSNKVHGFCSPTCKNVFVLKNRQILACITCKVKKYNFDLIQFFQGRTFKYAICSLNCMPCTTQYMNNLKSSIVRSKADDSPTQADFASGNFSIPVISSVSSMSTGAGYNNVYMDQPLLIDNQGNVAEVLPTEIENSYENSGTNNGYITEEMKKMMMQHATEEELKVLYEVDLPRWNGIITSEILEQILAEWKTPPETRTMSTLVKPRVSSNHTQTEESALHDMERVPLKTLTNTETIYVPVPIPIPVYIPVPTYLMETPIPYPFPLPIPVPVPIPVVFNKPADLFSSDKVTVADAELVDAEPEDVEMTDLDKGDQSQSVIAKDNGPSENHSATSMSSSSLAAPAPPTRETPSPALSKTKKLTRVEYGIRAWKISFGTSSDPLSFNSVELAEKLAEWVNKGTKPNGERYRADIVLYLCLGVQQHIKENGRSDNIFYDVMYTPFVDAITNYAESGINTRIEDNNFWESQQLGDTSPGVLLFTMIYLLNKHFNLKTWEKHSALHFGQIKVERRFHAVIGKEASFLRITDAPECEGVEVIERPDTPEKCPVRLLNLYISKCTHADGQFYKAIKADSDITDSIWYSDDVLNQMQIYQMLVRAMMIKASESDR